jgi:hypothetical protein
MGRQSWLKRPPPPLARPACDVRRLPAGAAIDFKHDEPDLMK